MWAGCSEDLGDSQGLIQEEVAEDYVYSIVKTLKDPTGVQYTLTYQKFFPEFILNIQAFFDEIGRTGMRDTLVYAMYGKQGLVGNDKDPLAGWSEDPYDKTIRTGALMNLSEQERFDDHFPGFPLSMCREFVRAVNLMI